MTSFRICCSKRIFNVQPAVGYVWQELSISRCTVHIQVYQLKSMYPYP